jgi:ABC-type antimicrobial peptide transport system permease subunit
MFKKRGSSSFTRLLPVSLGGIFAGFALVALALATTGLYSVMSYTVAQRTGEFGIRIALGTKRKDALLMVIRSAARSVTGGVLTGVALTIILNRVLARWIQGNSLDVLMLAGVILLLVATSGLSFSSLRKEPCR